MCKNLAYQAASFNLSVQRLEIVSFNGQKEGKKKTQSPSAAVFVVSSKRCYSLICLLVCLLVSVHVKHSILIGLWGDLACQQKRKRRKSEKELLLSPTLSRENLCLARFLD